MSLRGAVIGLKPRLRRRRRCAKCNRLRVRVFESGEWVLYCRPCENKKKILNSRARRLDPERDALARERHAKIVAERERPSIPVNGSPTGFDVEVAARIQELGLGIDGGSHWSSPLTEELQREESILRLRAKARPNRRFGYYRMECEQAEVSWTT